MYRMIVTWNNSYITGNFGSMAYSVLILILNVYFVRMCEAVELLWTIRRGGSPPRAPPTLKGLRI